MPVSGDRNRKFNWSVLESFRAHAQRDRALVGKFDRVTQQIHDDLTDSRGVAETAVSASAPILLMRRIFLSPA